MKIVCREIHRDDLEILWDCLSGDIGPSADEFYWINAIDRRLSGYHTPPGLPRYGYLLENDGAALINLLIFSSVSLTASLDSLQWL